MPAFNGLSDVPRLHDAEARRRLLGQVRLHVLLHGDRLRDLFRMWVQAVDPVALAGGGHLRQVRRTLRAAAAAHVLDLDQGARRAGLRAHVPEALTNGPTEVGSAEAERTPSSAR